MNRSLRTGLIGVMLGMFTAPLDGMMLGPALPAILADLGGLEYFAWIATACLICMAAATPIRGKPGDLHGRKTVYTASIVLFLLGSGLSGMSQDMIQLVGFRAVQGLGAGGLMVGALALIAELVPPRHSGKLTGLLGTMMPIAFIAGPLLGGLFTEQLSWRWAFHVNIPIGAAALLLIGTAVRLEPRRIKAKIDYVGGVLLTAALVALSLIASWGGTQYAWASGLMQSTTIITINSAEPRDMGAASGSVTLWHTMGASLGVAALGALYTGRLQGTLVDRLGAEAGGRLVSGQQLTAQALQQFPPPVRELAEVPIGAAAPSMSPPAQVLAALSDLTPRLEAADAFVVVTPEYNHSYPAALKNAIDRHNAQFHAKPVAFVSYGGLAGGLRAVEHLRAVFAELHAVTTRDTVSFHGTGDCFGPDGRPKDPHGPATAADTLLDQVTWWARVLRDARTTTPYKA